MAPLPIITNVWRIAVNYASVDGLQPVNVFHVRTATNNADELADAINLASSSQVMMNGMSPDFDPPTMTMIRLDGSSASVVRPFDDNSWETGSGDGQWSAQVCAVVSLRTAVRGARGRGRVYVGPLTEEASANGLLAGTIAEDLTAAWSAFGLSLAGEDPAIELGVASYTHADFNPVTNISVSEICGTQRRRQDQLR